MNKHSYDRRRGPDILVKWVRWAGAISWFLVIASIVIALNAKPQFETFFERFNHIQLSTSWNQNLLRGSFVLLILLFLFCMISLIFNAMRQRRRSDKFNKSIIINAILSFIGILFFIIFIL